MGRGTSTTRGNRKWASRKLTSEPSPGFNRQVREADEDYERRQAQRRARQAEAEAAWNTVREAHLVDDGETRWADPQ